VEREFVSLEQEEGMQLSSNGYVQRSAAQWHEIIARYRQSGLAMKKFCEQEGLTFRTFEEWERRQRRTERSKGQFVEVKTPSVIANPWAVEVEFPNGVRLRVRG
jgi:lambda repressor-like predicted transcriptional regulator